MAGLSAKHGCLVSVALDSKTRWWLPVTHAGLQQYQNYFLSHDLVRLQPLVFIKKRMNLSDWDYTQMILKLIVKEDQEAIVVTEAVGVKTTAQPMRALLTKLTLCEFAVCCYFRGCCTDVLNSHVSVCIVPLWDKSCPSCWVGYDSASMGTQGSQK